MRKLTATAFAVMLVLATASVASAAPVQGLTVKVSPAKKSKKGKPTGVQLDVTTTTDTDNGIQPPSVTRAVVQFAKGFKFNNKAFPTCDAALLKAGSEDECKKAKVGSGSAIAKVVSETDPNAQPIVANAQVQAFNSTGNKILLYITTTAPATTKTTLVGTLKPGSGKYGQKLDIIVDVASPAPGFRVILAKFNVKVKGKSKGKNFVEAPTTCSGSWPFTSTFTFADGVSKSADATTKCS